MLHASAVHFDAFCDDVVE